MNIINVNIDFTKGINKITGINLITGDYASTKMVFQFDRTDGTKVLEMKSPSGELVYLGEIINNEVVLARVNNGLNYSIFSSEGRYIYEVSLYVDDSKLTSVKGELPVAKEQVIIDGAIVEPYLPLFDELMQDINSAITETNNLNISASKSEHTTTITITDKEGQTNQVEILDGEQGPAGQNGEQGPQGEQGPAGRDGYVQYTAGENINIENNVISATGTDLTDYVKNTDYATTSKGGVITVQGSYNLGIYNGAIYPLTKTYEQYQSMGGNTFIGKATLENVITGKGLVSNTDYANANTGGVITLVDFYNTKINSSNGRIYCDVNDYATYQNKDVNAFISKGTLNNVITGKGLNPTPKVIVITESDYNALTSYEDNTEYHIIEG